MDSSLDLLHGWDPTGISSCLEKAPYPTLWLESCDTYRSSYMLASHTFVKELYFNSPYNYVQHLYIRMPAINSDNVTQSAKLCIDFPYFREVMVN